MDENNKNKDADADLNRFSTGCFVAIAIFLILIFLVLPNACSGSSRNGKYDQDLQNGMNKFKNGERMSKDEKNAVNDFFEWENEQTSD